MIPNYLKPKRHAERILEIHFSISAKIKKKYPKLKNFFDEKKYFYSHVV